MNYSVEGFASSIISCVIPAFIMLCGDKFEIIAPSLWNQVVGAVGQRGGVQLKEGGEVVGVRHRHQVVDGAAARI